MTTTTTTNQFEIESYALVDGSRVSALSTKSLVDVDVDIINVVQNGSKIEGDIRLKVDFGFGDITVTKHFALNTGVANPITVNLGTIDIPFIGSFDIIGVFTYDIPRRQVCGAITLSGLINLAKKCVNW